MEIILIVGLILAVLLAPAATGAIVGSVFLIVLRVAYVALILIALFVLLRFL